MCHLFEHLSIRTTFSGCLAVSALKQTIWPPLPHTRKPRLPCGPVGIGPGTISAVGVDWSNDLRRAYPCYAIIKRIITAKIAEITDFAVDEFRLQGFIIFVRDEVGIDQPFLSTTDVSAPAPLSSPVARRPTPLPVRQHLPVIGFSAIRAKYLIEGRPPAIFDIVRCRVSRRCHRDLRFRKRLNASCTSSNVSGTFVMPTFVSQSFRQRGLYG